MPHSITGVGNIATEFKVNAGKTCKIANYALAVDDMVKTIFFNCVSFSSSFSEKSWELLIGLVKGKPIYFEGRTTESEYTNKEGKQVKARKIVVSKFEFVGGKRDGKPETDKAETTGTSVIAAAAPSTKSSEPDDEIPF